MTHLASSLPNLGHATTVFGILRNTKTVTGVSYHGTTVDSMDLPPVNSCRLQAADWSLMPAVDLSLEPYLDYLK